MEQQNTPIFEVLVMTNSVATTELDCELGHVKMIPFGGDVKGRLFNGALAPGGVDTQVTDQNQVRHMSARYILTGKDYTGADCSIYVENNAWFTNGERPKPWHSVPTFLTDSKALAPILHRNHFVGEGMREADGLLHIRFYELDCRPEADE